MPKHEPKHSAPQAEPVHTEPPDEKPMGFWRKLWWFIWEDNSVWSWIVNIILAFLIIKFLVYPGLGLVLGTNYPIVAVVSGSMEHRNRAFDDWWVSPNPSCCANGDCKSPAELYQNVNLSDAKFRTFKFPNGFNKGDLMVLMGPKDIKQGDVVVFGANGFADPIIHRVMDINGTVTTRGDNNCNTAQFEREIPQEAIVGKAALRIPLLGWIKIFAVQILQVIAGRA